MAGFAFEPNEESLAVDINEINVYFGIYQDPLTILTLQATDGAFVSARTFTNIAGHNYHIILKVLNDNSGYIFISNHLSTGINNICKYLFATSSSAQCQQIDNFSGFSFGHIKLSDSQYFFFGIEPASTYHLHFYKVTIGSTAVDWANKMLCASGTCTLGLSEAVLDSDGTKIYAFPSYGSTKYLYFITLKVADGSVLNSRYKSSVTCSNSFGSAQAGDYLALTGACSGLYLILFNLNTSTFTFMDGSLCDFNQVAMEPITKRVVGTGCKSDKGYITKFYPNDILAHPDFTQSINTMITLSSGTDDVISESGATISSASTEPCTPQSFSNQSLSYVNLPSEGLVLYVTVHADTQLYTTMESLYFEELPDLACSYSTSTSISFSISDYNGTTAPSWVKVDSSTGLLKISAPAVSENTTVSFYEDAIISGVTKPVHKIIQIKVINCAVTYCLKCLSTSSTTCETCDSECKLRSGSCVNCFRPSEGAKSMSTAVNAINSIMR